MLMLTKMRNFFKNYWLFILLAALVMIMGVIKFTRPKVEPAPTPSPAAPPTLPFSPPQIMGDPLPEDTKVSIESLDFLPTAKVYQGERNNIPPDKAKEIASSFGFTNEPQISKDVFEGKFHVWSTDENYLTIGLDSTKISYGKNLRLFPLPTSTEILPSFSEAQEIFNNFLTKTKVALPSEPRFQNPKYLSQTGSHLSETTLNEADFIQVGVNWAINGDQLLGQDPDSPSVYALIGKDRRVYRFEYFVPFSKFSAKDSYLLKSLEKIKTSIISEGKIVASKTKGEKYITQGLSKVDLNEIFLAYFEPLSKGNIIIQPIFVLKGQGILPDKQTTQLTVYLPAFSFGESFMPSPESKFKPFIPEL